MALIIQGLLAKSKTQAHRLSYLYSQPYILLTLSFGTIRKLLIAAISANVVTIGIFGAYLGQWLFGLENNIYFQISLIMLMGLLAKNAILIVEFAVQRRRMGESLSKAAINAAMARLRPILMTSFAFIVGLLPLVFATGVGAAGNRSVATGAAC